MSHTFMYDLRPICGLRGGGGGRILSEFYSQFYLVLHKVQFNRKFEVTSIHFKNYSLYVLKKNQKLIKKIQPTQKKGENY